MELQKIYKDEKGIITAFAESRIGGRSENQDSYGWQETSHGYLVTVCDGMGGGPGGRTASSIAVREIITGISEANKEEEVSNIIIKAVRRANMAIIEAANETPALKGMGSTATVLLISEHAAYIAHVGDSRVYQIRGSRKVFRTFDHSMVFDMVAQGVITEEQARLSADSNIITRALGIQPDVEVDIQMVSYEKGDRFMLCSDGIHGMMPEAELLKMVSAKNAKLGVITDNVATYVDNIGRSSGGGHDNLTIALIETKFNSKYKSEMSKQTKITLAGLIALALISIILNIVQCSNSGTSQTMQNNDSINVYKDSVKNQKQTIQAHKEAFTKIENLANEISGNNQAPVDTIKKITNQYKQ